MNERTATATTVEEDGVRVDKSFTDDAFPVPAVTYTLSSDREDAVRVRIVDRIPESFPMDRVGFHPDYESENWTAYKDHRVEFERVLEPGELVETVFGIRDDDPELEGFLGAPVVEHVPVGEEISDVLGAGDTDAVREVLAGDREMLPGMEDLSEEESRSEAPIETAPTTDEPTDGASGPSPSAMDASAEPDPRELADETTAAVTRREAAADERDALSETEDTLPDHAPEAGAASEPMDSPDASDGSDPGDVRSASPPEGGIASALADEIRSGEVDDDDLRVLRSELDVGVPRSIEVRLSRLQSSVADIEAYADALAEFIDEEGTAREILDEIDARVGAVETELDTMDDRIAAGERAHGELTADVAEIDGSVDEIGRSVRTVEASVESVEADVSELETDVADVETAVDAAAESVSSVERTTHELKETVGSVVEDVARVEADVSALGDDVETLYEEVDDAVDAAERADGRVDDLDERLGEFDEEFNDLWDDSAELDARLCDVEDRLGDDLEDVDAELATINEHLEQLEAFRKRLNEAFGP